MKSEIIKDKKGTLLLKIAAVIAVMVIIILLPIVITNDYIVGVLVKCALYVMFATAVNIVQGFCGMSFLGSAGLVCVGAYVGAIAMKEGSVNFFIALIVSGIASAFVGFLLSLVTVRLKGAYLGIVTVGFSEIIRTIAQNWTSVTGGAMGIKSIPVPSLFGFKLKGDWYFYITVVLAIICIFITSRIINSQIGRVWKSIKADPDATLALGVPVQKYKTMCFVIGVFWAGVGGCFWAAYYRYISSDMFTMTLSFNVLSMVIVGGMGTISGPVFGSVLITVLNDIFEFIGEWRQVGYGIVVILTLWLKPSGIAGIISDIKEKIARKREITNAD